jgi:hypothetical protein
MGGDGALADETVGIETFIDLVVEVRSIWLERASGHRREQTRRDENTRRTISCRPRLHG